MQYPIKKILYSTFKRHAVYTYTYKTSVYHNCQKGVPVLVPEFHRILVQLPIPNPANFSHDDHAVGCPQRTWQLALHCAGSHNHRVWRFDPQATWCESREWMLWGGGGHKGLELWLLAFHEVIYW